MRSQRIRLADRSIPANARMRRSGNNPERQVDPARRVEQGGSSTRYSIDAVVDQPRRAAHDHDVAGPQPDAFRSAAAVDVSNAEQRVVAKRDRYHRLIEIILIAILMHPHARIGSVPVDQTALRCPGLRRDSTPYGKYGGRDRRPFHTRRMPSLVTVAMPVSDPAKSPRRCHTDRHRPSPARHRRHERCGADDHAYIRHRLRLRRRIEKSINTRIPRTSRKPEKPFDPTSITSLRAQNPLPI